MRCVFLYAKKREKVEIIKKNGLNHGSYQE